jgi:hypothetical protein
LGNENTASGYAAHAEGYNTTASGSDSHAEGNDTKAIGDYSHAEGYLTIAGGTGAHAEGTNNTSTTYTLSGAANATTYAGEFYDSDVGKIVIYNDVVAIITAVDTTAGTITLNKTLSNSALNNV